MKAKSVVKLFIFVVFIIMFFGVGFLLMKGSGYNDHIGSTVVIKGDTCTVLAYDYETYNYVLDDGRQISERMVELFKIEE